VRRATAPDPLRPDTLRGALRACTRQLRQLQQQHQQQRQRQRQHDSISSSSSSGSNEAAIAAATALAAAAKELLLELSSHPAMYLSTETLQDVLTALQWTRDYTGVAEVSREVLFVFPTIYNIVY
jgi:hypothetical protein